VTLARELGVTRERVGQQLLHLNARGRVVFVDPDHPFWLIKRADDESVLLTRDETRVLSAVPAERAVDLRGLTALRTLAGCEVGRILDKLVKRGLVEVERSPGGRQAFRLTSAGVEHPQYVRAKRPPPPPRLPVRSDRVRLVLQTIADADALRIRDVKRLTNIPQVSINALMQYLKRKRLVVKTGDGFEDPYRLTEQGGVTLSEMTLRRAA
jgi:predicted transcriptional regulator